MSKSLHLEFLETRNLLAGEDEDSSAMDFEKHQDDDLEGKSKYDEKAEENFYGALLFLGTIMGTALFVGLGIYFGETV